MGTTPTYALPYPELDEPDDVPTDMRELALAVEAIPKLGYWYSPAAGVIQTDNAVNASGHRFTSGPAGNGGLWVDGGTNQFFGSIDANTMGLYNGNWTLKVDDAQNIRFYSDTGKLIFGTAADVYLFRWTGGLLGVSGQLWAGYAAAPGNAYVAAVAAGDGWPRIGMLNNGTLWFGIGTAGPDTSLTRYAASHLRTEGNFSAGGNVYVGANLDTYIYRRAGNKLGTVGSFAAEGAVTGWGFEAYGPSETYPRSYLRNDAQLWFGPGTSAVDTVIYRAAAKVVDVNGSLRANGGNVYAMPAAIGNMAYGIYNSGAGWEHFRIYGDGKIEWGAGQGQGDTVLYREGVSVLRTRDYFRSNMGYMVGSDVNYRMIRAGSAVVNTEGNSFAVVNFDSPFPNTCDTVLAINGDTAAGFRFYCNVIWMSTAGFNVHCVGAPPNAGVRINYVAFGH